MPASLQPCTPQEVLDFWFKELSKDDWFRSGPDLDQTIEKRFADTHLFLARGIGADWQATPSDRVAAIIVLDQFARNIYRATPLAFATDGLALREARIMVDAGDDRTIPPEWRTFAYLPFEHSENLADQDRCVALFTALGNAEYLDFAERHRAVIRQFGRFPHRNAFLGRTSTTAEQDYLAKPGAGF